MSEDVPRNERSAVGSVSGFFGRISNGVAGRKMSGVIFAASVFCFAVLQVCSSAVARPVSGLPIIPNLFAAYLVTRPVALMNWSFVALAVASAVVVYRIVSLSNIPRLAIVTSGLMLAAAALGLSISANGGSSATAAAFVEHDAEALVKGHFNDENLAGVSADTKQRLRSAYLQGGPVNSVDTSILGQAAVGDWTVSTIGLRVATTGSKTSEIWQTVSFSPTGAVLAAWRR